MSRIRKINVSQVEGNTDGVLLEGTIVAYEVGGEYRLRVHDGVTEGGVPFPNAPSIVHNDDINITINSEDSSTYTWNFGQTGDFTAPGDITTGTNGGRFVQDCGDGITSIRWINIDENNDAELLRFYTGDPGEESGDAERAQIRLNWQSADQSGLTIKSFDQDSNEEHDWEFRGDGSLTYPDGTISTGGAVYAAANASVQLISNNENTQVRVDNSNVEIYTSPNGITQYQWTFGNTGNLSAPGNVTVAGNLTVTGTAGNVATKSSGAWTVPTGNSTQSFTVDPNNTYQMWVEGNIPNGIIAWNATVTITNINVPVLGQQFAWNYEGGGNILMFNSIPNQFVGTAGAISNAEPAVANTNVFSFGINNASGNTVSVRYGWIQIST